MNKKTSIPLPIDINRVLEVLAAQIYQSPLALIRENLQNAYDATLIRMSKPESGYEPKIEIQITSNNIQITDNGIGMSQSDIENHFWRAGSSSKNTEEAKAAGVVGTFGIGAMANFGIAEILTVESENYEGTERTLSSANRKELSATEDCIDIKPLEPIGNPGTTITVELSPSQPVDVNSASENAHRCVRFLPFPVYLNETLISQESYDNTITNTSFVWEEEQDVSLGSGIHGHIMIKGDGNGAVWVHISQMQIENRPVSGKFLLYSNGRTIQTYRSGFSLATTTASSSYQFGGIADASFLIPTAGREALESSSQQIVQTLVSNVDKLVSIAFSKHKQCNRSNQFLHWALNNNRMDLCDLITIRYEPGDDIELKMLKGRPCRLYNGQDPKMVDLHSSDESRLAVLASTKPRLSCQNNYLNQYSQVQIVDDTPKVDKTKRKIDYSTAESSFVFRVISILESDYFINNPQIELAEFTHPIPVLVKQDVSPVRIFIGHKSSSVQSLLQLYATEYEVFGHMVKDFIRSAIFPKISNLVPSATREGAEAFLRKMRDKREPFEYSYEDLGSLSEIWANVAAGKISVEEGAKRSQFIAQKSIQVVDSPVPVAEVVPDLTQGTHVQDQVGEPMPAISRTDIETDAKLLIMTENEPAVSGYRCFISITETAFHDRGDFFLEPHSTSIVWGGQRVLFVFEHHSQEFGLYYDIQTPDTVTSGSGGGRQQTCSLFMKNKVFIPIPPEIQGSFIPKTDEQVTLQVRFDVLYTKAR